MDCKVVGGPVNSSHAIATYIYKQDRKLPYETFRQW